MERYLRWRSYIRRFINKKTIVFGVIVLGVCQNKLRAQNKTESLKSFSYIYADQNKDGQPDHLGEQVTVTGIANVRSDLLDSEYLLAFIQNGSTGLLIYHNEINRNFNRGDSLVVTGEIQIYEGRIECILV